MFFNGDWWEVMAGQTAFWRDLLEMDLKQLAGKHLCGLKHSHVVGV